MTLIGNLPKAGKIPIRFGQRPVILKWHQTDAIRALNARVNGRPSFAGLLVMPTGSGKTITAAYWLLQNVINQNKKLVWIAHRHELLVQALHTFAANASAELLPNRQDFQYRIISGLAEHDQPVNIHPDDDLIVASKDSLQQRGLNYLLKQWATGQGEIFLVIDEAHHATAKTYRFIIDSLSQYIPRLKILGLTATPIRTSEQERGLLKKIFPDDIVYKIDLKTLIAQGILAEPVFRDTLTHYEIAGELSEQDIERIKWSDLPSDIAKKMATQKERNHLIVSEYFNRLSENGGYGQTLVFALNIDHAIALDALFNEWGKDRGIKSAFVVSSLRDGFTGVTISQEQNRQHIEDFRNGKLQVLINVLILTEGVDLPQAETVFLTRPTISQILMTQMIGRVLRGPEMGGTRQAYVVSFIDDWQDKISWISPEFLYDLEAEFPEEPQAAARRLLRLISVAKVQEFARLLDQSVNTEALERLPARDRIPSGLYSFTLLNEKHCLVLVYSHQQQAFEALVRDLPQLFKEADLDNNLTLTAAELERILPLIKQRYFADGDPLLAYHDEELADFLIYFGEKGVSPPYLEFKDRDKCDISRLAAAILERRLDPLAERDYLNQLWDDPNTFWQIYYGHNKKYFLYELQLEKNKLLYPEDYPEIEPPQIVDVSAPPPDPVARDAVLARDGYRCLCCGEERRYMLQVDHVNPRAHGGQNDLDNLQTLCRVCNGGKGDSFINFRERKTPLTAPPANLREFALPPESAIRTPQAWDRYLRRLINFFYQGAAVADIDFQADQWQVSLHSGNDLAWLEPYLEAGVLLIQDARKAAGLSGPAGLEISVPNQVPVAYFLPHRPTARQSTPISKKFKELPTGTKCRFVYKQRKFEGQILDGKLVIDGKRGRFTTLSAASRAVTKTSRNGWKDWELKLPDSNKWVLADEWRAGKR